MNQSTQKEAGDLKPTEHQLEIRQWLQGLARILTEDPGAIERLERLKRINEENAAAHQPSVGSKPAAGTLDPEELINIEASVERIGRPRLRSQRQVLETINVWIIERGCSPTLDELRDVLQIGSRRTVQRYLDDLSKQGFIERTHGILQLRLPDRKNRVNED